MSNKYVVVDIETTGNSPKKGDKIIQFAACVVENGKIVEEFSSFVNPERSIPPFIEELTGLTDEIVCSAPLFSEIAPKVLTLLDGAYFVAHNVLFDLSFLQEELIEAGYEGFFGPVLDTVEMARILFPTADSYKLNDLANREGLDHDRPHQADSDAYVTAQLLVILLGRLWNLPAVTIRQLLKLSGGLKSDVALLLDDLMIVKESKVEELASTIDIHRGIALIKIADGKELKGKDEGIPYPKSHDQKEPLFRRAFPIFEKRIGQFDMMDSVFGAFSKNKHALIEAGTGVGKSLAYLIPSAFFSIEKGETVVISTYTTQLQHQLLTNEIPLLEQMLPFQVSTVLLKGRNHYISLAKFEQALKDDDDNYDTILTKMQILVWLLETKTGDYDELNISSGGMLLWDKIKNDETTYFKNKSWLSYDFYVRARRRAQKANIIITNHSLLLTDLVSENAILPHYRYCVIDEGHHFEKAAGKHFGDFLDYFSIRLLLSQFGQYEQKQYFYRLDSLLKEKTQGDQNVMIHPFEVNQLVTELIWEMNDFFKAVTMFAKTKARNSFYHRRTCRFSYGEESKEWSGVVTSGERFSFLLKDLIGYIENSLHLLNKREVIMTNKEKKLLEDVSLFCNEIKELREKLKRMIFSPSSGNVAWIEIDERSVQNSTTIYSQPVSNSNQLSELFFKQKESVIITSATLSVKNSFQYIIEELGLISFDCQVKQIESPFDYKEQVQLIIPNDLPEVNSVPLTEYVAAISEHIISIAEATKGRMLILFTSYEMLRKTYDLIKESGLLQDYVLIGQGITGGSRARLTRNFKQFEKAILLGTSSFWEGVDIPGEDLSCLIIVRLPFSSPYEPITEAKCELVKKNGGNPFSDYSLPEAILRFKQGFGRLIRTSSDRGIVIVFDKRIKTTSYGKAFLQSIPSVPIKNNNIWEIVEFIQSWLK